jgi:enoyl-CoA hydratase/carnithine racemase
MAIALACDLRLAASSAKCGITPARLGIVYGYGDTRRLVETVGPSKAKDILFTGRIMDATEAHTIGLVDELHPPQELEHAVAAKCALIAGNSQWSVRGAKETIRRILSGSGESGLASDSQNGFDHADFREGRAAFMEKRAPKFPYR